MHLIDTCIGVCSTAIHNGEQAVAPEVPLSKILPQRQLNNPVKYLSGQYIYN